MKSTLASFLGLERPPEASTLAAPASTDLLVSMVLAESTLVTALLNWWQKGQHRHAAALSSSRSRSINAQAVPKLSHTRPSQRSFLRSMSSLNSAKSTLCDQLRGDGELYDAHHSVPRLKKA